MVEKYYDENGWLALLVSKGFGAGWSTWNQKELAYDKRIVEKWIEGATEEEMKEFLETIGYNDVYMGGYEDLEIEWILPNMVVQIREYDGAEYVFAFDDEDWIIN